MKKEREILRNQLELLAKDSEKAMPDEISCHAEAMTKNYKALAFTHPAIISVIGCVFIYGLSLRKKAWWSGCGGSKDNLQNVRRLIRIVVSAAFFLIVFIRELY